MKTRIFVVIVAIALVGVIGWRVYSNTRDLGGRHGEGQEGPVVVDTVRIVRQDVPVVLQATGHAQTEHSVAVRAQVGGVLKKILFNEGDEVKAGQLLFVIDPESYQIQVAQMEGQVKQDEAKLGADTANVKRMSTLTGDSYVSAQDFENAQAQVKVDKAAIDTDKARLEQARMELGYTRIRAPIDGKTGSLAFKSGNLVQVNAAAPLVTINQIAPVLVQFDVPQSQLPNVLRYSRNGDIKVTAVGPDGRAIEDDGDLIFIDNGINAASGTVSLKARFPNAEEKIWPGQLMTVKLTLTTEHDATVVPTIAVQPGQGSSYVYTVAQGKIGVRNVQVQREYQGLSIIGNALKPGELVV
ncbi:MAG TPA: efflux RND transporter periplasmic adaptor subunit, partial [Pseudomonadales bacterium]|nr:efflux RND transporter periplasmic adaptor subunit [Pseudomonadales bacterium]